MGVALVAFLAGCGHSADTVTGDKGYTFRGKPIDCIQVSSQAFNNFALTCDFVGWHQKNDPAK